MLGKASEIVTYQVPYSELNDWLRAFPDFEILDIKYALTSTGYGYALIIYKEANQHAQTK